MLIFSDISLLQLVCFIREIFFVFTSHFFHNPLSSSVHQLTPEWPTHRVPFSGTQSKPDLSVPSLWRFATPRECPTWPQKLLNWLFPSAVMCADGEPWHLHSHHSNMIPCSARVFDTDYSSKQVTGSKVSLARRSHWVDPFHFCTKWCFLSLALSLSPVTCWNTFRSWVELLSAHSSLCVVFEDYYAQRHPHWASRQLRGQNP